MRSTIPPPTPTQAERREQRIRRHKEEVVRLREEFGDPREALFRFIVERFEPEALVPDDHLRPTGLWEDNDDLNGW